MATVAIFAMATVAVAMVAMATVAMAMVAIATVTMGFNNGKSLKTGCCTSG